LKSAISFVSSDDPLPVNRAEKLPEDELEKEARASTQEVEKNCLCGQCETVSDTGGSCCRSFSRARQECDKNSKNYNNK